MKYIDADKLKAEIERRKQVHFDDYFIKKSGNPADYGASNALAQVLSFIDFLQQEQSESSNGKFLFPSFLYARTVDNKTIDVAYAPQSMDAVEYIRNELTVQAEMDLEEEIDKVWNNGLSDELAGPHNNFDICARIARHFYELGFSARKEE